MLLENTQSVDEKLPEDVLKEIYDVIEECGGGENTISKDEMRMIVKEKKQEYQENPSYSKARLVPAKGGMK